VGDAAAARAGTRTAPARLFARLFARAFERDRERDLALAAAGWRCVRITWRRLEDGIPQDLRTLLAQ
jgi:hypothetical protein